MKPHGTYKLSYRNRGMRELPMEQFALPVASVRLAPSDLIRRLERSDRRVRRILDSLRAQILAGGAAHSLRIRRVFLRPREIYRLELELPDLGLQRTTFLDREALEELLEQDDVREIVEAHALHR
jgi:hypothetical protein